MDKNEFSIPLNGLAGGKTRYGYAIGKEFFESYGNTEILNADLQVTVDVEKSGQYIGIDCRICGDVVVECDRCLEPLTLPVDTTAMLSVKFGAGTETEEDEAPEREIVWLSADNTELDLAQIVYDYVCISIPQRRFHADGQCSGKVLEYLKSGISVTGAGNDAEASPFASLKGLFGN